MEKKIDIGQKAIVVVKWNTTQQLTTKEEEKNIISLMAKKYGIPEKNIKIEKNFISPDGSTNVLVGDSVKNINDPKFMLELMKQYIALKGIKDIDFEEIVKIDSRVNSTINFDSYEKGKKYSINWIKWDNFLSYGPDNFFDFTKLHGLVLLNGQPANKSGKSTFAYDLIHFLLFGKTNTNKAKTLGALFNNYLPDCTTINVEGCITIDGEDYIIKRTLTRPASGKKTKTVTNKVEYYKVSKSGEQTLLPDENNQGESAKETNKVIKEALGNESDFDLIISANAKDLDSLISLTETEKGRLLTRWIGLSVIEDKDAKAREIWNKEISIGRYSDMYNEEQLKADIEALKQANEELKEEIEKKESVISECDKGIKAENEKRDILLSSKLPIDDKIINVDVTTLNESIKRIIESGKKKNSDLEYFKKEVESIGEVTYSDDDYRAYKKKNEELIDKMAEARTLIKNLIQTNKNLESAESCPLCHRKFDNIDNSETINKNKKEIDSLTKSGISMKATSDDLVKKMAAIDDKRAISQKKSQLELKIATINSDLASQRLDYKEKKQLLDEINKNKEAISKNSEIDAKINVINANIKAKDDIKRTANSDIVSLKRDIDKNTNEASLKSGYIVKIEEERKIEKYWKLYLQMIGKDGIGKMVLRNTLPIINGELDNLLSDVCDFTVEIVMNDKNDIDFILHRDGISTNLSAASGLEKTQASLALRVVLGELSKLSRPPFILLDEVLGTVARENYDSMEKLYRKISKNYDFILHITHINDIVDWHDGGIITVVKENNISTIKNN